MLACASTGINNADANTTTLVIIWVSVVVCWSAQAPLTHSHTSPAPSPLGKRSRSRGLERDNYIVVVYEWFTASRVNTLPSWVTLSSVPHPPVALLCRRHLPQRSRDYSPDRRGIARAKRRMATATPLHASRSHGRTDCSDRCRRSAADPMRGLSPSSDPLRRRRHECKPLRRSAAVKPRSDAPQSQGLIVAF